MSLLGRFTFWGGVKRIGLFITFILLIPVAIALWDIFFDGSAYRDPFYVIYWMGFWIILIWAVLLILKWILSGFFKK